MLWCFPSSTAPLADRFDCVFWCGDMNYRCDLGYSEALRLVQGRKFSVCQRFAVASLPSYCNVMYTVYFVFTPSDFPVT